MGAIKVKISVSITNIPPIVFIVFTFPKLKVIPRIHNKDSVAVIRAIFVIYIELSKISLKSASSHSISSVSFLT